MIKLTYSHLARPDFHKAVNRIYSQPFPGKVARQIQKIAQDISESYTEMSQQYQDKMVKRFASKFDKNGQPICDPETGGFEIREDAVAEFDRAQKKFDATLIELKHKPIALQHLLNIELSPKDLMLLEPLYHQLTQVK